jgi:diguanylate cyclase (GGDEF)-like protein
MLMAALVLGHRRGKFHSKALPIKMDRDERCEQLYPFSVQSPAPHSLSEDITMPTFPTFDGGRPRNWKSPSCTTQPAETPIPESPLDSESLLADAVSRCNLAAFFKFTREKKRSPDQSLQSLLSESELELATLLQEVHASSDAAPGTAPQSQPSSELLMRAVDCAVKQHLLQLELGSLALTDELTGLYNRRGFLCLTEEQLKLAHRAGCDMALFSVDVDGLKQINDSFGHSEGDCALIRTAEVLRMTFRGSDVLARLGGDEFTVLAIEASGRSASTILARLRENLETVLAQEQRYPLSLSVGVAQFTSCAKGSIAELMLQADQAMYRAKRNQEGSMRQSEAKDSIEVIPINAETRANAAQEA